MVAIAETDIIIKLWTNDIFSFNQSTVKCMPVVLDTLGYYRFLVQINSLTLRSVRKAYLVFSCSQAFRLYSYLVP